MKILISWLFIICVPLVACDIYPSTMLILRPTSDSSVASRGVDNTSRIDTISSVLEENGLEKLTYTKESFAFQGADNLKKRVAECGHPYYWQGAVDYSYYEWWFWLKHSKIKVHADMCITEGEIRLSITPSTHTEILREAIISSLSEKLPSMEISIE